MKTQISLKSKSQDKIIIKLNLRVMLLLSPLVSDWENYPPQPTVSGDNFPNHLPRGITVSSP